jgi:RND family efflux transporter MFP subunit
MTTNTRNPLPVRLLLLAWLLTSSSMAAEYPARLDWERRVELSTPVSGVIAQVPVQTGQRVTAGEVLVELDQRLFQARLSRAEADLAKAQETRDEAMRELERTQELFDRTLLSEHDLQLAQIAAAAAQADQRSAEAAVTEAGLELEYSRIRSPFDAWVVKLAAQPGETVVNRLEARTLAVVVPADRMRALAWLNQAQLERIRGGVTGEVVVAGDSYRGETVTVALEPDKGSGESPLYRMDVLFKLPQGKILRPQRVATIKIDD